MSRTFLSQCHPFPKRHNTDINHTRGTISKTHQQIVYSDTRGIFTSRYTFTNMYPRRIVGLTLYETETNVKLIERIKQRPMNKEAGN